MGDSDSKEDFPSIDEKPRRKSFTDHDIITGLSNCKEKTVRAKPLLGGKRSALRARNERQAYRQIAQNGYLLKDFEGRGAQIRSQIRQGLFKKRRASRATRIEVCIPPGFLSGSALVETGPQPVGDPDDQSESFKLFSQYSQKLSSAQASSEVSRSSGRTTDSAVMPYLLQAPSRIDRLGGGRIDPFAKFPITMSRNEEWLIDQMHTLKDPALQTLRNCWYPVAIRYPASFHQFLANLALNVSRAHGVSTHKLLSVAHHSQAIQLVNRSLLDPELGIKDDVVATVVTFINYSILTGDFRSWKTHIEGLEKVVGLRGGYKSIENDMMLCRLVFCVDVSGASRQDLRPRFPYSPKALQVVQDLVGTCPDEHQPFRFSNPSRLQPRLHTFGDSQFLIEIAEDLAKAMKYAMLRAAQHQLWRQVNFIIYWIDPVLHRLLSVDVKVNKKDSSRVIHEAIRLGIILFLGEVRRKCGVMCVSTIVYLRKLKKLLSETDKHVDWALYKPIRLFLLFFGLVESWQQPEAKWYIEAVSSLAIESNVACWEDMIEAVKSFFWFEDIFDSEIERFRYDVMTRIQGCT